MQSLLPLYNRDLLLKGILANGASATGIKPAVAEIQREETISEEEKEDEPTQDVIDQQENSDRDNSPIDWPDSLKTYLLCKMFLLLLRQ